MEASELFVIISSCSARKDDCIPIPTDSKVVNPSYYLANEALLAELYSGRERVFADPKSRVGQRETYAFDLYVRAGNAYKDLFRENYHGLKQRLLEGNDVEWFFLSGGYGIIHALEKARKYQATFSQSIAYQKKIPYTACLWENILPKICDAIFSKFNPECIYVFGSRDYTQFVKQTYYWKQKDSIKIFESTGSQGPFWLSPIINSLANAILNNNINTFNEEYSSKFIKQQ